MCVGSSFALPTRSALTRAPTGVRAGWTIGTTRSALAGLPPKDPRGAPRAVGTTRSALTGRVLLPARSGWGCQQKPAPVQSGIRPRSLFLHGPHSHRGQGGWHYPVRTVGRMGVPARSGRACTLLSLQNTSLSGESGQSGIQSHQESI